MQTIEKKITDNDKLLGWLSTIPHGEYQEMRERIMAECYITRTTLSRWLNGSTRIPPLAKIVIERIANEKIF